MSGFIQKLQSRRVASRFSLVRKLGQGGFGVVYLGRDFDTGEEVAMKMEHRDIAPSVLEEEYESYSAFKGLAGFPEVYWYGWQDDYKILVMQLLGPSLDDLFCFCGGSLSLKTVLMIADQILSRLEQIHSKQLLHRDIKPQNFLLGTGKSGNVIYVTDFGLVREYAAEVDEHQETVRARPHLIGTARFASVRGHLEQVQSPRDDLESFFYMLVYFLKGRLPWQGLKAHDQNEKGELILQMKQNIHAEELCRGLPHEFAELIGHLKSLAVGSMPDYAMLRERFRRVAAREGIEYDDVYDWTVRIYLQQAS